MVLPKGKGGWIPCTVVARWVGRRPETVRRWVRDGHVQGRKIGRHWYVARDEAIELRDGPSDQSSQE